MKLKFDKYWLKLKDMNKMLLIVVILDPRYKLLYVEYFFPKLEKDNIKVSLMIQEMKALFLQLYYEYVDSDPVAAQASLDATIPKINNPTAQSIEDDSHAANMHEFMKLRQEKMWLR